MTFTTKKNNPLERETGKYMTFVRQPTQVQRPGSSATNPSYQNYKPGYDFSGVKFPTTPTTPKIEQPKIEQPKTQQPQVSPYQPRINEEKQSFNSYNTLLNKTFDNRNKAIQSQMPYYEKGITNEQERAKQRLAEIDRRAALDQETTQTEADVATKNLAKTKQVQDVQRRNMFANLGTIESGGFMGFLGQQTNADEQFLTDLANITQQAQKIKDNIRAEAKIDRMTVEKIMEDTVAQFRNEIIKLKNAVVSNEDERQLQILNLKESLKARLYDIADQYETREAERKKAQYDLDLEERRLQNEIEKEKIKKGIGEGDGKDAKSEMINIIDQLINSDTKPITGLSQIRSFIPGDNSQGMVNLYNQLKGLLSLENRQMLKGSGAISDFEARVLEQAASSLGRNLSDDQFKNTLLDLRAKLSTGQPTYNQNTVTMIAPDGAMYSVDQSEVREALQNGWKLR